MHCAGVDKADFWSVALCPRHMHRAYLSMPGGWIVTGTVAAEMVAYIYWMAAFPRIMSQPERCATLNILVPSNPPQLSSTSQVLTMVPLHSLIAVARVLGLLLTTRTLCRYMNSAEMRSPPIVCRLISATAGWPFTWINTRFGSRGSLIATWGFCLVLSFD